MFDEFKGSKKKGFVSHCFCKKNTIKMLKYYFGGGVVNYWRIFEFFAGVSSLTATKSEE
jgi:hypothetical protein